MGANRDHASPAGRPSGVAAKAASPDSKGHNRAKGSHATGREKWLGHLAALLFAALIAGSFSIGDLAAPHLSPTALNAVRFVIAVAILAGINIAMLRRVPAAPPALWRFAILGGLMALYFVTMFIALQISEPVSTGAVFTLSPLMSAGFGLIFLGQRTQPMVLAGLLVAACGAVWVIFNGDLDAILGFRIGTGEAIFFLGCAGHAAVAPLNRLFNRGENGAYFSLFSVLATMLWIVLFGFGDILETDWAGLPAIVWVAIAYLSIFTTAGTFFLVQYAAMRLPASKVLSYGYLTPSFVILIEGMIGHGWASATVMAGALVTAGALLFTALAPDG